MNILPDEDFTVKIADFGASELISPGEEIQGNFGYLDSECLMTRNLTVKNDVFSFEVVIVELLTGQEPNYNAWREA